jgi:predicted O-methyltransferase YrrM
VIVPDEIEAYAEAHTTPLGELFARLAAETRERMEAPQMMVGPVEGRLLEQLVRLARPHVVLELGTFTGYSSICMASALPPEGRLITCDVNDEAVEIARRYAAEAGVIDRIEYIPGPALDTVRRLDGPFDLVFVDADKGGYVDYYEAVLPKLAPGGVIVADNTLSDGRVVDDEPQGTARAIVAFNEHVRADERVVAVMLTVRDGVTLIRRRD